MQSRVGWSRGALVSSNSATGHRVAVVRLALVVALVAVPVCAQPLEVRVLFGGQPAPPETEVRLFEPSMLCGTAQRRGAPLRHPDAQGRLTFETASPRASLSAEHPALGTAHVAQVGAGPVVVVFPAGAAVAGAVLDDRGQPAEGARVSLVRETPAEGGAVIESNVGTAHLAVRSLVTKADGRFEFLGLAPGRYAAVADDFTDVVGAAATVEVKGAQVTVPPLRLRARFRVNGRVLDARGGGVKARVVATLAPGVTPWPAERPSPWERAPFEKLLEPGPPELNPSGWIKGVSTDDDGAFSLPVEVKGPVVLEALADCASVKSRVVEQGSPEVVLRLPALATLEGRLLDAAGTPAARARLSFVGEAEGCSKQTAEVALTEGKFSLSGLPSSFTHLEVEVAGAPLRSVPVSLVRGRVTQLGDVRLARGATLFGRVLGADGKPRGGAAVSVGVRGEDRGPRNFEVRADGTFEVTGLAPGRVTVAAEDDARVSALRKVVLLEGRRVEVELRFAK